MSYYKPNVFVRAFVVFSLCSLYFSDATHANDQQLEELKRYKSEIRAAWRGSYTNTDVGLTKQELTPLSVSASINENTSEPHQHSNNGNHLHSYHLKNFENSSRTAYLFILVYLIGLVLASWLIMKKLNN